MRELTPLCRLAKKYQTDKGGRHESYGGVYSNFCHEYTPVYWDMLGGRRNDITLVLELGINAGGSLRMWRDFFPKAIVIGLDWNKDFLFVEDRIYTRLADEREPAVLADIARSMAGGAKYDLIIDDGSHETSHQITNMLALLPLLAKDGIYVVEDLQNHDRPDWVSDFIPPGYGFEIWDTEMTYGLHQRIERLLVVRHV